MDSAHMHGKFIHVVTLNGGNALKTDRSLAVGEQHRNKYPWKEYVSFA